MSEHQQLFRQEAVEAQQAPWLGTIVLVRPVSFRVMTILAAGIAFLVILYLIFGSYTDRSTVTGQLVPQSGQVKVYVPQTGVVLEKLVQEGQTVKAGDPLYRISSERYSSDGSGVQANISSQLAQRRLSLMDQLEKTRALQANERENVTNKLSSLKTEMEALESQVESQRRLVEIATDATNRYKKLLDSGYISMQQLQQREVELLGQQQTLQGLERQRASLQQQLVEQTNTLQGLKNTQANQSAEIERQISLVEQDLAESEAKRTLLVTAPESGIATAILAEVGQVVDGSRPLLSIVPEGAPIQAELYAPSRAIGFIKPGARVLLRYQPFPYQKFGQYKGEVISISRTSIPANEISAMIGSVPGINQSGEQLYRIRVRLDQQVVHAYGDDYALQSGMLVEADILQDTRRLYEWVLEPLFTLSGKS